MENILNLIMARQSIKAQIEELTKKQKEIDGEIESNLGLGTHHVDGFSVIILDKDTTRFDSTKFKAENPDLYKSYTKSLVVHSFTIKDLKED